VNRKVEKEWKILPQKFGNFSMRIDFYTKHSNHTYRLALDILGVSLTLGPCNFSSAIDCAVDSHSGVLGIDIFSFDKIAGLNQLNNAILGLNASSNISGVDQVSGVVLLAANDLVSRALLDGDAVAVV
jgi:hypothetical protein